MAAWKLSAAALCLLLVAATAVRADIPEPEPEPEPCTTFDSDVTSAPGVTGATYYFSNCPVLGTDARQVCLNLGAKLSLNLQLANVPQRDTAVVGKLVYAKIGENFAWINAAPNYQTPFDIPGRPTAGPVGRNCLALAPLNADGTNYDANAPATRPTTKGDCSQLFPVVCSQAVPSPVPPPATCVSDDPEFLGWAITTATGGPNKAADALCPPGYTLGNLALNNLYRKADPTLFNPNNPHDYTGFPFLPDLVAKCAAGKRVWANTAPYFTTAGLCVSFDQSGTGPKATGGNVSGARDPLKGGMGTNDPLCSQKLQALCFNPSP